MILNILKNRFINGKMKTLNWEYKFFMFLVRRYNKKNNI